MKKIYFMLAGCLLTIFVSGQGVHILKYGNHSLQNGDTIIKQQVKYVDPGKEGSAQFWDFQQLQPVNEQYVLTYFRPSLPDTSQICGMEHRTRYYYRQQRDSLQAIGFENATTYMRYIQPELRLHFPLTYGDTLSSRFTGMGQYCHQIPLRVNGHTQIEVDGEGDLLLPEIPTIKKALRVHTLRHYSETGKDSVEMDYDIYSWYAAGSRYPVFESIKTSILKHSNLKDTIVYSTSFYYPPEMQKSQTTADTVKYQIANNQENINTVFTEAHYVPNPVTDHLNIDYKLTRRANVWFSLHSSTGIMQCSTTSQFRDEGYHNITIPTAQLMTGVYCLYVHVDNMILKVSIIKV